ncbi:unnamed protein product, partial [Amoebophrya sp. A25]
LRAWAARVRSLSKSLSSRNDHTRNHRKSKTENGMGHDHGGASIVVGIPSRLLHRARSRYRPRTNKRTNNIEK